MEGRLNAPLEFCGIVQESHSIILSKMRVKTFANPLNYLRIVIDHLTREVVTVSPVILEYHLSRNTSMLLKYFVGLRLLTSNLREKNR